MILLLAVLIVVVQFVLPSPAADDLVISLPNGKVQGRTYLTDNNITLYGFQGIPYATPPLGSLRFEAPKPAKPWDGVFDATKDGYACLSSTNSLYSDFESEDCLVINVYTPSLKPAEKLPVMFWIYGGGFVFGNSRKENYGPDFLIEEDVIVVSFNYRLGPFGFLSTGDTAITGNFGLKDQNLALKWTKQNVEYFGGDPDKITIFGESAGAMSTTFHLLSEKSAGLLRAAIAESGTALLDLGIDQNPMAFVTLLVEGLSGGDYLNDTYKLKKFLQETPAQKILDVANSFNESVRHQKVSDGIDPHYMPAMHAWPVIEVESEDAFLTESPYSLFDSGRFNQVPMIMGINSNEALTLMENLDGALRIAETYDTDPSSIVPPDLNPNSTDLNAVIKTIQGMYLKQGENFTTNLIGLTSYYSDNLFCRATQKTAELYVKRAPFYLYQFAHYGRPLYPFVVDGAEKVGHAVEIGFLFKTPEANTTDPLDILTQNRMVKLWTNFAKYLNPTPEESELLNVTWPVTSATEFEFLNINNTLEVRSHLRATYPQWTDIYETYGRKPFITY